MVRLTDRPDMAKMLTVDVKQQNNNIEKNNNYSGGRGGCGGRGSMCVAWWKGAGVTFGNSALFKDPHIVYD